MKIIAYFLPQFHQIPENDKWWGEGFTEWTNTKKARPFFEGHYQPREPYNDYYYDLTDENVRKWQIDIAKKHNIYGFCYYHYWLNGKQLLEKPVDDLIEMKELDMPFCICWANHTWNRSWTHEYKEVLMLQTYGEENEWEDHFNYLLKLFNDTRYIKIENKPIFVIYRPADIPNCKKRLDYYNRKAQENGFDGVYFVETLHMEDTSYGCGIEGFSAAVEFEPMYTITPPFSNIINYDELWEKILTRERPSNKKYFLGGFTGWDNTARKKEQGLIVLGSTPKKFGEYMKQQIKIAGKIDSEFIFVNAWNEWAEGAYLEPDKKYGYGYLECLKDATTEENQLIPLDDSNRGLQLDMIDDLDRNIVNHMSVKAKRVLHINCGKGILGKMIKKCTDASVYGMCYSKGDLKISENNLDFVTSMDYNEDKLIYLGKKYDHIILDKIFENIEDPWNYINKVNNYLEKDGSIFIRASNIANIKVIMDLIANSKWKSINYNQEGDFRFYTLIELKEIINLQEYKVKNVWRKNLLLNQEEERFIKKIKDNKLFLKIWNLDWDQEMKVESYLIEVIRKENDEHIDSINEIIEKEFKQLKLDIKNNISYMIENGQLEDAKAIISECKDMFKEDSEFVSIQAVIEIMEENFDSAEVLINEGLKLFKNDFDLTYNIAYVYEKQKRYEESLYNYNKSLSLTSDEEKIEIVNQSIEKLRSLTDVEIQTYNEIVFELSGYCNARCKYCVTGRDNRSGKGIIDKGYISLEDFEKAVRHLLDNYIIDKNTFFHLYNYGEPFLNPDILRIFDFLEKNGFSYGVSTNASIPRLVDKTYNLKGLKALKFSMPGFSEESYKRMHGFNFSKIKDNITKILKNYRNSGFDGIAILGYHVYQFNLDEIEFAKKFAEENNMKLELCNAYFCGYNMFKDYIKSNLPYNELKEVGQELILQYINNIEVPKFDCPHHNRIITIDEKCNLLTCCVVDKECDNYYLGNIFELDNKDIKVLKTTQSICKECLKLGIGYYSHNPIIYCKDKNI